jgi:outer membrane protein assembly factor BamD
MKRNLFVIVVAAVLASGCANELNKVYKSTDYDYRYEYAKQCFAFGKYGNAESLLLDLISLKKGTDEAQESLYMLAMSQYMNKDYESASETFQKFFTTYPKSIYAENAAYYVGRSLYMGSPEPRLDQTPTLGAISAFQRFLDNYPDSPHRQKAQKSLFELQDKLVMKELLSAKLYYNLGGYFGNVNSNTESNYISCIVTSQNALKLFPYSQCREDFSLLIMRSKYQLAVNSSKDKQMERYREAEDECYGFLNEYPDSPNRAQAEKLLEKCKKVTKD